MRKNRLFTMAATLCAALCISSCSNDVIEDVALPADSGSRQVTFTLTLPSSEADTRMSYEPTTSGGLKATWSKNDKITVYTGHYDCATFTLVGDGGTPTGTFTGEIPEEWALEENQELWINYPELEQITIGDKTRYCFIDGRKQTGKLDDFMDIISGQLIYTGGSLKVKEGAEIQHMASYLHLQEDIELFAGVSSLDGDVTLTLSNIISGQHSGGYITDNIEVTATLSGGRLTSDVYIGFLAHPTLTPNLEVECGEKKVTYTLDRFGGYKAGEMYTVNNIASLATPGPLTLEAIDAGTITIKNPMGLAISYEKEGEARVTSETGNTDDIIIEVSAGTRVRFYGDNQTYCNSEVFTNIDCSSDCYIYGNIMSLINSQNYYDETVLRETYTFSYLFRNNKHIKNHNSKPLILPATTLSAACYSGMFYGCELLETAPELPSEQLASRCYWGMFGLCSALTTAPELRAQTLAEGCYYQMFGGCSSLETAPELLAKELKKECYYQMFAFCPMLNSLTCLATVIPDEDCTYQWLRSTSATGTFTKAKDVDWPTDNSGTNGWDIVEK